MKKTLFLLIVSFLFLTSCSKSPSKVAINFMENLRHGKIEEAKKYATDASCKQLDLAAQQGGMNIDPDYKCKVKNEEIDGNKAVVKFDNGNSFGLSELRLVKIDGDWKVHLAN